MKLDKSQSYCNPLSLPNIPRGKDFWYKNEWGMFSHENKPKELANQKDYRSISDPTVFYYDNKWYLYPSYGMCWYTENFKDWKFYKVEPYCSKYSPSIIKWKDNKFLLASWYCPLYYSESPLGPFIELGDFIGLDGEHFRPCDPGIFIDDDNRIYLYAFNMIEDKRFKEGFRTSIVGYELDYDNPRQVVRGPVILFEMDPNNHPWERQGLNHQDKYFGWIEGPHMLKVNKRYYLVYAAPDTCDASYVNAVYYSDKSPLDGFICQKNNPVTYSYNGLIKGAGHGSIVQGPNNTLYCFYTIACPHYHMYERRIGMDLIDINSDGELYAPHGITNTPQFIPGYIDNASHVNNSLDYINLSEGVRATSSTFFEGREAIYATDSSALTYFEPSLKDKTPWLEVTFTRNYYVGAIRLFFRDVNLDYAKNILPRPVRYIIEGQLDNGEYFTLLDRSDNKQELNIDYQTFKEQKVSKVRLRILKEKDNLRIGVIDFSVFGFLKEGELK